MTTRKLDHTIAELYKLKNQIRVQLNRIRPYREPPTYDLSPSGKKRFPERSRSTSLIGPPQHLIPTQRSQQKKHVNPPDIYKRQVPKVQQRKHFKDSSKDQIKMRATTRRTSSSYLQIRPKEKETSLTPGKERHNTSLMGVGMNDKSNEKQKPSKRIVGLYHVFNFDLI